jgi:septal ring factor EnvC (AmiA/AmiB activator)
MTFRATVVPLGFGLSAVLCTAAADEEPAPGPRTRVYTNEDLDRVRPFRAETGIASVPADPLPPSAPVRSSPGRRGEDYWRREAARVRERLREMEAKAGELRARIAEREEESSRQLTRRRRSASTSGSDATLRARLAALERRMRQTEDDLLDRARRERALPGWLRE